MAKLQNIPFASASTASFPSWKVNIENMHAADNESHMHPQGWIDFLKFAPINQTTVEPNGCCHRNRRV